MPKISLMLAGLLLMSVGAAQAEVISITDPRYEVPNSPAGVLRPTPCMSMAEVEERFGAPQEKLAPVGDPPITRWIYPEFEVFFEYNLVIHSVVKREE
jgi:hypothetical protein